MVASWQSITNCHTYKMKLDKDTYLLAEDLFIRLVTREDYKGDDGKTAVDCIRRSLVFHTQWEAIVDQSKAAAAAAVANHKPVAPPAAVQPLPRKADNARQTIAKAPPKALRAKAPAKRAKALKAKRKAKR
jgi:hypothetical protein